ncbi:MAG TPA: hypothetical protein VMT08_32430 [Bradyrhizobium sp.]|nr:hypothetical protein [Bradyrhizobium sp.]
MALDARQYAGRLSALWLGLLLRFRLIMSAGTERLTTVIGRRIRAMAARFKRPSVLKGMSRAEFEQVALDLDLSHPELYGLLTGRTVLAGSVDGHLNKLDASAQRIAKRPAPEPEHLPAATQVYLPIGPSCC